MAGTQSSDWLQVATLMYPTTEQVDVSWDNLGVLLMLADKYNMKGVFWRASKFLDSHVAQLATNKKMEPHFGNGSKHLTSRIQGGTAASIWRLISGRWLPSTKIPAPWTTWKGCAAQRLH